MGDKESFRKDSGQDLLRFGCHLGPGLTVKLGGRFLYISEPQLSLL